LAAVVDFAHNDTARRAEAEKDTPFADTQAISTFQRTFERLDVATARRGERFHGKEDPFRFKPVPCGRVRVELRVCRAGAASQTEPPLQFAVRDRLSLLGFGGQDARYRLFIGFLFRSFREPADEFLIGDGRPTFQKRQESVDLVRRQSVDDFVKPFQVAHD
jgi:hypothetical protein